jgi:hypothetical protein
MLMYVMAESLHDGEPDTVRGEHQRTMFAECQVNRFDERVEEKVLVYVALLYEEAMRCDGA